MSSPLFSFAHKNDCNLNLFKRFFVGILVFFLANQQGFSNSQNGLMVEVYSVDLKGTDLLLTGTGISNSPFPAPGIEPGPQRWKASVETTRPPSSPNMMKIKMPHVIKTLSWRIGGRFHSKYV